MLEFCLVGYLVSMVGCSCFKAMVVEKIYKSVADKGYIIEKERKLDKELNTNFFGKSYSYIPIVNIVFCIKNIIQYFDTLKTPDLFEKVLCSGALSKMTAKERREYNRNKTGSKAQWIATRLVFRETLNDVIVFDLGEEQGKIFFRFDPKINGIEIIDTTFRAKKLTEQECRELVLKAINSTTNNEKSSKDTNEESIHSDTLLEEYYMDVKTDVQNIEKPKTMMLSLKKKNH